MQNPKYRVIFKGEIAGGAEIETVKLNLAELQMVLATQKEFYAEHRRYAQSLDDLEYAPSNADVHLSIVQADDSCFQARGRHLKSNTEYRADCNGLQN